MIKKIDFFKGFASFLLLPDTSIISIQIVTIEREEREKRRSAQVIAKKYTCETLSLMAAEPELTNKRKNLVHVSLLS
jgi:hypothetical protein